MADETPEQANARMADGTHAATAPPPATVYVIGIGYDDSIVGVFSSEAKAQAHLDADPDRYHNAFIQEFEIDRPHW
jgi:hypothetical protein